MELTQEQRQYLDGMDLSSKRLLRVINDLLDMSKIRSGKLTFTDSNVKIIDAIEPGVKNPVPVLASLWGGRY